MSNGEFSTPTDLFCLNLFCRTCSACANYELQFTNDPIFYYIEGTHTLRH